MFNTNFKKNSPISRKINQLKFFIAKNSGKLNYENKIVGISGLIGKSTTALACHYVLSENMKTITVANINHDDILQSSTISGMQDILLRINSKIDKSVIELNFKNISEIAQEIDELKIKTLILVKISGAISEFANDLYDTSLEQAKLIEKIGEKGLFIVNYDDLGLRKITESSKGEVIFYGFDKDHCHVWAGNMRIQNFQTIFELNYGVERVEINSKLLGFHQIYPMLAAASLGVSLGMPLLSIKKGLEKMMPLDHHLEVIEGHSGSIILDDNCDGNLLALEEDLETLNRIPARRRIVVLGEMSETKNRQKAYSELANLLYKNKIDLIFTGSGDTKYITEELDNLGFLPDRMQSGLQNPQIVSQLLKVLSRGDVVLVKAEKAVRLDEVVQKIGKRVNQRIS